jgi:hypothetical protein
LSIEEGERTAREQAQLERERAERAARDKAAQEAATRRRVRKVMTAFCMLGILGSVWGVLRFNPGARRIAALQGLYPVDSNQLVALRLKVVKDFDSCGDNGKTFTTLPATLNVDGQAQGLSFIVSSQTLEASIPYRLLHPGAEINVMLGVDAGHTVNVPISSLTTNGELTLKCGKYVPVIDNNSKASQLPSVYHEIWINGNGDYPFRIDLDSRQFVTKDDAYRIDSVMINNGTYKVVGVTKAGYATFFLRNNNKGATFELAACPKRNGPASRTEALKATEACTPYETMRLYYPNDDQKIFLRVKSGNRNTMPLEASELRKAMVLWNASSKRKPQGIGYYLHTDRGSRASYNLSAQIRQPIRFIGVQPLIMSPFDREYLTIQTIEQPSVDTVERPQPRNVPVDTMATWLESLDEAIKKGDEKEMYVRYQELAKKGNKADLATGTYSYAEYLIKLSRYQEAEKIIDDFGTFRQLPQEYYDKLKLLRSIIRNGLGDKEGAGVLLEELNSEGHSQDIRRQAYRYMEVFGISISKKNKQPAGPKSK